MNAVGEAMPRERIRAVRRLADVMSCCLAAAVTLVVAFVAATDARAAAEAASGIMLKLKAGAFDPAYGLPERLGDLRATPPALPAPKGLGPLFLVQYREGPSASEQGLLEQNRVKVLDFVPEHGLIVRLPEESSPDSLWTYPGVRAVVSFAPMLRLSPDLGELESPVSAVGKGAAEARINAWLTTDADPGALAAAVPRIFEGVEVASVRRSSPMRLQLAGSPEKLATLARSLALHPEVLFVDIARPNRLLNDQSVWIGQSYDRVNGPGEALAPDPKPYSMSGTVFNRGITGTNQIIGIADTRLEHQMCYFRDPNHAVVKQTVDPPGAISVDPTHRKILAYNNVVPGADSPPYPAFRHGTHTTGSAAGDSLVNLSTPSTGGHDAGDGMAPNSKIIYLDMYEGVAPNCTDYICGFCGVADILQQEYEAGARISTNSWGNDAAEGGAADADVWQHPDHLVLFASGNDGTSVPIQGTAGAKNVLGIGASENYDATFHDSFGIRDPENMASFSSVGPSWDGRVKPDLIAPGQGVASANFVSTFISDPNDPQCNPNDPNVCILNLPTVHGCYVTNTSQTCTTIKLSGTSMSTPTAAGLATLARQYFTDGFYPSGQARAADARTPSAALLKAVLINGARNMTGRVLAGNGSGQRTDLGPIPDAPSNRQGWGRLMLDDALYFAGDSRRLFTADVASAAGSGLATGDSKIYKLDVTSTASPLKVTLAWTDPPSSPGAAKSLVNDLDLIVTAPDGTVYRGNQWTADNVNVLNDKQSAPNPASGDSLNNVEGFLVFTPQVGQYRIEIRGVSVPGYQQLFTQGYAFAVTGVFTGAGDYCGTIPPAPSSFTATVLQYNDVLLSWQAVSGAASYEIWRHTTGCTPPLPAATVMTVPGTQTSFHDVTTQASTTYYYSVRALLSPAGCRTGSSTCVSATTPPPPTVQAVAPDSGTNNNPTPLTITGLNFQATPRVFLGTAAQPEKYELAPVSFVSATQVTANVPVNLQSGGYAVKVKNPDGLSSTLANAFFMGPPLQSTTMFTTIDNTDYYAADSIGILNLETSVMQPAAPLTPFDNPIDIAVNRTANKGVIALYPPGPSGEPGRLAFLHLGLGTITKTVNIPFDPAGTKPVAVALHPSGNPAYVVIQPSSSNWILKRYDLLSGTFTGTITLGAYGDGGTPDLEISPDAQRLYSTNPGDDTLSVIRISDFTEIARIPVGDGPYGIAVSPNSKMVYTMNLSGDTVSVVDAVSLTQVALIDVSYRPNPSYHTWPKSGAVSPDGTKLYVGFLNTFYYMMTIDLTNNSIINTISQGYQVEKVQYVTPQSKLYSLAFTGQVKRHNPATLAVDWTGNFGGYTYSFDWTEPQALTITSINPNLSCPEGNGLVLVRGSGYQGRVVNDSNVTVQQGTRVFFGGQESSDVILVNSTSLYARVPASNAGPYAVVDVQVLNPNGRSALLTGGLRYTPCGIPDPDPDPHPCPHPPCHIQSKF